jgi:hypothetical protein
MLGVLILFRFGMPYRTPSEGMLLRLEESRAEDLQKDWHYRLYGYVGLGLVLAGTALQILGNVVK